jgi:UDP-N-acetylglucosamine 4-epimerase
MASTFSESRRALMASPKRWLVTGAAGFIGSNLVQCLLDFGQDVTGLDNFATGHAENLREVETAVGAKKWSRFRMIEGDIRNPADCAAAAAGAELVLHQAALGSVPRSFADPLATHHVNLTGFLNVLIASRDSGVKRLIYAASSSTYGDEPTLPKAEDRIGRPLSPYAVTKLANELYANVLGRNFGIEMAGLRYFNVFGPRQDPNGPYAAVIPRWIAAMLNGDSVVINGDGDMSRDFCYVANAVQANILAATAAANAMDCVYNVAVGMQTSLNQLFDKLKSELSAHQIHYRGNVIHGPLRPGDIRHSLASIERAGRMLGYMPTHDISAGLTESVPWYLNNFRARARA